MLKNKQKLKVFINDKLFLDNADVDIIPEVRYNKENEYLHSVEIKKIFIDIFKKEQEKFLLNQNALVCAIKIIKYKYCLWFGFIKEKKVEQMLFNACRLIEYNNIRQKYKFLILWDENLNCFGVYNS